MRLARLVLLAAAALPGCAPAPAMGPAVPRPPAFRLAPAPAGVADPSRAADVAVDGAVGAPAGDAGASTPLPPAVPHPAAGSPAVAASAARAGGSGGSGGSRGSGGSGGSGGGRGGPGGRGGTGDGAPAAPADLPAGSPPAAPGPGAPPPATGVPVLVVDELDRPVPGATVRFGDGTEAVSDARGEIGTWPTFPGQRVEVVAAGFVASALFDLASADRLHLRRVEGAATPAARAVDLAGVLAGPAGPLAAGWVRYAGDPGATSPLRYATDGGAYALPVVATTAGEPRGVLLAEGSTADGQVVFGLSTAFAPFAGPAPALAFVPATRRIAYAIVDAPADLAITAARCELERADGEAVAIAGAPDREGTFLTVPDASWPGTRTRVVLAARAGGGRRESVAAIVPTADRAEAALLDPPAVTVDAPARQVAWAAVAGAKGYRVEIRSDAGRTTWEAFTAAGLAATVPVAAWPEGGEATVQAIDAPGLASRTLAALPAGPRRLRLAPWTAASTYRVATTRVRL